MTKNDSLFFASTLNNYLYDVFKTIAFQRKHYFQGLLRMNWACFRLFEYLYFYTPHFRLKLSCFTSACN